MSNIKSFRTQAGISAYAADTYTITSVAQSIDLDTVSLSVAVRLYRGLLYEKITTGTQDQLTIQFLASKINVDGGGAGIGAGGIVDIQGVGDGQTLVAGIDTGVAKLKNIKSGTNVSIVDDGQNLVINSTGGVSNVPIEIISNVGPTAGAGIYKGLSGKTAQLRKITAGNNVTVTQNADEIVVSASIPPIPSQGITSGQNVGSGYGVFKEVYNSTTARFKSIVAGNNISITSGENELVLNAVIPTITPATVTNLLSASGTGVPVFKELTSTIGYFRKIKSGNNTEVTLDNDEIVVNAIIPSPTGVETIVNVGEAGAHGLFKQVSSNQAQFLKIKEGNNVSISTENDTITISAVPGEGATFAEGANIGAGEGAVYKNTLGSNLQFRTIKAGDNIAITQEADQIVISAIEGGETTVANVISSATAGAESVISSSEDGIVELKGIKAGSNTTVVTNGTDIVISSNPGVTSGTNVGTGEGQVFKQINSNQIALKTIKAGENITITDNGTEILIDAETGGQIALDSLESVGTAGSADITAGVNGSSAKFKGLKAGQNVSISEDGTDVTISASFSAMESGQNDGDGSGKVFKTIENGVGNFRSIKAGNNISISQDENDITINAVGGDTPAIGDVENIGNVSNAKIGAGVDGSTLQLRTLKAGQNITITEGADEIVIGSNMDLTGAVTDVQNKATAEQYDASIVSGVNAGVASVRRLVAGDNVTITEGTDVITISSSGGGEGVADTFTNLGDGEGKVYESTNSSNHNLRSIKAGTNITISQDADNIYINSTATGGADSITNVGTGEGSIYKTSSGSNHSLRKIKAGSNVTVTTSGDDIVISSTATGGGSGGGITIEDHNESTIYAAGSFAIVGTILYRAKVEVQAGPFNPLEWEKIGDGGGDSVIPEDVDPDISGFYGPYGVTSSDPVITLTFLENETQSQQVAIGDKEFAILPFERLLTPIYRYVKNADGVYVGSNMVLSEKEYSAGNIFEIDITNESLDVDRYIQIAFMSEPEMMEIGGLNISNDYLNISMFGINGIGGGFNSCAFIRLGKNQFNQPLAYGRYAGPYLPNNSTDYDQYDNFYNTDFNNVQWLELSFAKPVDPMNSYEPKNDGWIGINDPIKKLIVSLNRTSMNGDKLIVDSVNTIVKQEVNMSIYGLVSGLNDDYLINLGSFTVTRLPSQTGATYDNGSDKYGNIDHIIVGSVGYEINVNSNPIFTEGSTADYWITQDTLGFLDYIGIDAQLPEADIEDNFGVEYEIQNGSVVYERINAENNGNGFGVTINQESSTHGFTLDIDGNPITLESELLPESPFFHGIYVYDNTNKTNGENLETAIEAKLRGPANLPSWANNAEFHSDFDFAFNSSAYGIINVCNTPEMQKVWIKAKMQNVNAHYLYISCWAQGVESGDIRFNDGITEIDAINVYLANSSIGFELSDLILIASSNGGGSDYVNDIEINFLNHIGNGYDYVVIEYIPNAAYVAAQDFGKSVTTALAIEHGYPVVNGVISFDPPPEPYVPPTLPTQGDYFYELKLGDSYGDGWEGTPGHSLVLNIDGTDYRITLTSSGIDEQQQYESLYFAAAENSVITLTFEEDADAYPDECSVELMQIPASGDIIEADFSSGVNVYNIVDMEGANGELISFTAPYA